MSIVRMQKLSVIGLNSARDDLVKELMRLGVVEITSQAGKLHDEQWSGLVGADQGRTGEAKLESRITQAAQALASLERYDTGKKPLFHLKRTMDRKEFMKISDAVGEIQDQIDRINGFSDGITEFKKEENKVQVARLALTQWKDYSLPLEVKETRWCWVARGAVPAAANVDRMKEALAEVTECFELNQVASDAEQQYLSVVYMKDESAQAEEVLRQFGFSRSQDQGFSGTAAEAVASLDGQLADIAEKVQQLEKRIQELQQWRQQIETLYDSLVIRRDQSAVRAKLLVTDSTFYLEGWMPSAAAEKIEEIAGRWDCWCEIADPAPDEEPPVLMHNGRFSGPFEAITKLYALPAYRGIDPTPYFSFFYAVFFGMMLSDAAYGLIVTVATYVFMKKNPVGGMLGQLMKMFFYCGISTIFWGVMFGGYFGDIITVVAKTFFNADIVIPAVWFNPLDEPMTMLTFSFVLGGLHLFLGMGVSAYMSIRDGKPLDALFDVGFWYLLLIGLVLWLGGAMMNMVGPSAQQIGMWMTIAGAAGILLTAGRDKKGFGRITGGLGSLYGITSYLADVLSYSRLLALGLATGVIASVINTLGSLGGGGITGALLMTVVFIVGHAYNLSINALGSFVHSSRLQYVEFFGKFYESGGEAFEPFYENTQYVDISKEEI